MFVCRVTGKYPATPFAGRRKSPAPMPKPTTLFLMKAYANLGVSAYSGDNVREGALGRFLSLVEAKKISSKSYLLIENFDRLSRENVMDAFALLSRILSAGITVVTLVDNQVYTKDSISKDFGQLIISLASMFRAHEESATKSKRVRAAMKAKRAAAMVQTTGVVSSV